MTSGEVITGDAVVLDLRLARLPSRALAFSLDVAVMLVLGIGLGLLVSLVLPSLDDALTAAVTLVGVVVIFVGVPVTMETLTRGRSLGKLALGLRVVRDDGGPVRFRQSLVRGLAGFFVDFWLTSGVGALVSSLLNEQSKRVGDLLAGTVVVRERVPAGSDRMPDPPVALQPWAATLELSQLPDDLAMAARTYLSRMPQLAPDVRDQMGARIATAVAARIAPPAPAGTPPWAYLSAVLAERSRRQQIRQHQAAAAPAWGPLPASPSWPAPGAAPSPPGPPAPADRLDGAWPPPAHPRAPGPQPGRRPGEPGPAATPDGFAPPR
jgi:uncharacterized RDD family membrane protein YckC